MGIYSGEIESFFKEFPTKENVLHYYDNWSYHIQLYMIPVDVYKSYTYIKSNFDLSEEDKYIQIEKLLLNNRIIIAESGVTSGISIDSLNLAAFTPTTLENRETTTTSIDLSLSEVNSCTLMNKIAMASYVCGYTSYTTQPFFIELWFNGYSNKTGKPVNKIPLDFGSNHIIYSCVMTTQSSIVDTSKTQYKMKLYPYYYSALTKELNVVNDIGKIESDTDLDYENYIKMVEDKINEKLAGSYGREVMDKLYKSSQNGFYAKPLQIIFNQDHYTPSLKTATSSESKEISRNMSDKLQDYKVFDEDTVNYNGSFLHDYWEEIKRTTAGIGNRITQGAGAVYEVGRGVKRLAVGNKIDLTPNEDDTLTDFIRRISLTYLAPYCNAMGVTVNFDYGMKYIGEHKGKMYYQHYIKITVNKAPGLQEMNKMICNYDSNENHYSDDPVSNQINYIKYLGQYNLLTKKYRWLLNGENIDVLNVKRADDNLWYMNIGLSNIYNIRKNKIKNQFSFNENIKEGLLPTEIVAESTVTKFNAIKKARANNGDMYIDDIYNILTGDDKQEGLKHLFGIVEASDPTAAIKPESIPDLTDIEEDLSVKQQEQAENEVNYKVGMYNIFQYGGQKLKLDMDIIGDPYWLILGSEKDILTHSCKGSTFMPHMILNVKTFVNFDKNDNYKEDRFMDLTTIYVVTEVASFFDNGKFTQKITGFVATPFIQSSAETKGGIVVKNTDKRAKESVPKG